MVAIDPYPPDVPSSGGRKYTELLAVSLGGLSSGVLAVAAGGEWALFRRYHSSKMLETSASGSVHIAHMHMRL
eukprot:196204-Prorocentrum_minimum.AAC.2